MNNISWKLAVDLDIQPQLFFNVVQTNYNIYTYICGCGENQFIIGTKYEDIQYKCTKCKNEIFYDANDANISIYNFLYKYSTLKEIKVGILYASKFVLELNIDFDFKIGIKHNQKQTSANYYINVPYKIDLLLEKIYYKKIDVYSYSLDHKNGSISEKYNMVYDQQIFNKLANKLEQFISSNIELYTDTELLNKNNLIHKISFFLKYPYFKEYEFYYWNNPKRFNIKNIDIQKALTIVLDFRKEKSIKKAIYKNYIFQINKNKLYYSELLNIFCKKIKDPNLLLKYIDLDINMIHFSHIDIKNFDKLIDFLQDYYTDKQILNMLQNSKITNDINYFIDTLNEFSFINDYTFFNKVKCEINELHNEFLKCAYIYKYQYLYYEKLVYTKEELNKCKQIFDYEAKLPTGGKDLIVWGNKLHNCMASYCNDIKNNIRIIYCFFKNDEIIFAVEIFNNKIRQASSKYNKPLNDEQNKVLNIWYKSCYNDSLK